MYNLFPYTQVKERWYPVTNVTIGRIITLLLLVCISIYTVSYGVWTWKKKNRLGAVMIFLVAIAAFVIPVYSFFFRWR